MSLKQSRERVTNRGFDLSLFVRFRSGTVGELSFRKAGNGLGEEMTSMFIDEMSDEDINQYRGLLRDPGQPGGDLSRRERKNCA
jgi:hypothetical protein